MFFCMYLTFLLILSSIKEESFLEYLDLENEDVQPVQRERSRTRRTRPRLSAFEVASKLAVESLKKGES